MTRAATCRFCAVRLSRSHAKLLDLGQCSSRYKIVRNYEACQQNSSWGPPSYLQAPAGCSARSWLRTTPANAQVKKLPARSRWMRALPRPASSRWYSKEAADAPAVLENFAMMLHAILLLCTDCRHTCENLFFPPSYPTKDKLASPTSPQSKGAQKGIVNALLGRSFDNSTFG